MEFIREFWEFIRERKKIWLIPIFLFLAIFLVLIIGSASAGGLAPFIYMLY